MNFVKYELQILDKVLLQVQPLTEVGLEVEQQEQVVSVSKFK